MVAQVKYGMKIKGIYTMSRQCVVFLLFLAVSGLYGQTRPGRSGNGNGRSSGLTQGGWVPLQQKASGQHPPSPGKAMLLSLLLPGAGQYYAGSSKSALLFLGSEVLVWSAYATTRMVGGWRQDDAVAWASSHAGIDLSGRDHDYFIAVENYSTITDYNNAKLQQRDADALYPEDAVHSWQWDSESSRKTFEKLRVSSDAWYERSKFIVAGVILNHIISGIDALRSARAQQRLILGVAGLPEGGFVLSARTQF